MRCPRSIRHAGKLCRTSHADHFDAGSDSPGAVALVGAAMWLLVGLVLLSGCAKVGDPVPPVTRVPKSTNSLSLVQTGQSVRLNFPVTEQDVTAVDIYKRCEPGTEWPKDAEAFRRVELTSLTKEGPTPALYVFQDAVEQANCRYAIRLVNDRKRASDLSNTVSTAAQPVPAPPQNLKVEVEKRRLILTWDAPSTDMFGGTPVTLSGYLVNGQFKTDSPRFEDHDFKFGEEKRYTVQAIGQQDAPLALSLPSQPLTVRPEDKFGPDLPANLAALSTGGKVQLVWEPSPDPDVKGYIVFRGLQPNAVQRLAEVPSNSFTDESAAAGSTYHYAVAGVDATGNEGPRSEPVQVVVNP